ncbi:hypothetical protein [Curtobacterium sp. B8]|uniref:hypothetical protein n=1 Tax=Curtobacterium sp. B8 TaxID=95611 RepID=UPI0011D2B09D|nr:hypothetical protein [Curtobacterium sp. B8]
MLTLLSGCAADSTGVSESLRVATKNAATPREELTAATDLLTAKCLDQDGFKVPTVAAPVYEVRPSITGYTGLFTSTAEAKREGYGTTIKAPSAAPLDSYRATLSGQDRKRFDRALLGDPKDVVKITLSNGATASKPSGGCSGRALEAVYGSVKDELRVEVIQNEILMLATNPAIERALRERLPQYQRCMAQRGVGVTGLNAAETVGASLGQYRQPGEAPSSHESKLAAEDAGCQARAKLSSTLDSALYETAQTWLRDHHEQIQRASSIVDDAAPKAAFILDGKDE